MAIIREEISCQCWWFYNENEKRKGKIFRFAWFINEIDSSKVIKDS